MITPTRLAAVAGLLLTLAACGGPVGDGPSASPSPSPTAPFDVSSVGPIVSNGAQCESQGCLVAGVDQRLSLIVADTSDPSHNAVADASVTIQVLDVNPGAGEKPIGPAQGAIYHGAGLQQEGINRGVYVVRVKFARPGAYIVSAHIRRGAAEATIRTPLAVAPADPGITVGAPAPMIHNLTAADVKDISIIDTGVHPDDMHYTTLADAIAAHHPVVVYLGTPGFCQSKTCAPQVGAIQPLEPTYHPRGVDFVHIETYKGGHPDARQTLNPDFAAFKVLSEPWVFIVDKDGRVAAKFSGATATDEIQVALDAVV